MKTKTQLLQKCAELGISEDETRYLSSQSLMDLLRDKLCDIKNLPPQIDVMLCQNSQRYWDWNDPQPQYGTFMVMRFWQNPHIYIEEKLDEVRVKIHFTPTGIRVTSRHRSDVDFAFVEKTANFPWLQELYILLTTSGVYSSLQGITLDGGLLMPVNIQLPDGSCTISTRQASVSVANSSPEVAIDIQERYGPVQFCIYDIIERFTTYQARRAKVNIIHDVLRTHSSELYGRKQEQLYEIWRRPRSIEGNAAAAEKQLFYQQIIDTGGEGVIFKDKDSLYYPGVRSSEQHKLKPLHEIDCFVVDWKPGNVGSEHENLVGALIFGIWPAGRWDGTDPIAIATVSGFSDAFRRDITSEKGALKAEWYGRVATLRYEAKTKNGKLSHAILHEWRNDKTALECMGYELEHKVQ